MSVVGPAVTAVREGGLAPGPGTEDPAPDPIPGMTGSLGTGATPGAGGGQGPRVAAGAAKAKENLNHFKQ